MRTLTLACVGAAFAIACASTHAVAQPRPTAAQQAALRGMANRLQPPRATVPAGQAMSPNAIRNSLRSKGLVATAMYRREGTYVVYADGARGNKLLLTVDGFSGRILGARILQRAPRPRAIPAAVVANLFNDAVEFGAVIPRSAHGGWPRVSRQQFSAPGPATVPARRTYAPLAAARPYNRVAVGQGGRTTASGPAPQQVYYEVYDPDGARLADADARAEYNADVADAANDRADAAELGQDLAEADRDDALTEADLANARADDAEARAQQAEADRESESARADENADIANSNADLADANAADRDSETERANANADQADANAADRDSETERADANADAADNNADVADQESQRADDNADAADNNAAAAEENACDAAAARGEDPPEGCPGAAQADGGDDGGQQDPGGDGDGT